MPFRRMITPIVQDRNTHAAPALVHAFLDLVDEEGMCPMVVAMAKVVFPMIAEAFSGCRILHAHSSIALGQRAPLFRAGLRGYRREDFFAARRWDR